MLLHTKYFLIYGFIPEPYPRTPSIQHNSFTFWTPLSTHNQKFLPTTLESQAPSIRRISPYWKPSQFTPGVPFLVIFIHHVASMLNDIQLVIHNCHKWRCLSTPINIWLHTLYFPPISSLKIILLPTSQ